MKCTTPKAWPQYLLTFLCNIGTLTFGLHTGWLAPLHLRLTSEESPLGKDVRLTAEEISWVGSIPATSFLLGTWLYGFLLHRFGRKPSALLAVLPNVVCFLLLGFARDVYALYAGRFIAGFAAAGSVLVTPVYVNESAGDDLRGFLCGLSSFFVNAGVAIAAVLGGFFPYWLFNAVCLSFSLIFVAFYSWLPETPVFLIARGQTREAADALGKLRRGTKQEIDLEIARLQNQYKERGASARSVRELLSDEAFAYALFLSIGVMTVHQLCGCSFVTVYSAKVFRESGSSLPPALAASITSLTLLFGSVLGAFLMDRVGRKLLLVATLIVMSVCLSILAAFVRFKCANDVAGLLWLPAAAILLYMGTFACGIGSVSFVLVTELFPPEVRGLSGAVSSTWASVIGFVTIKFFPTIVETSSLVPVLIVFIVCCVTGAAFVHFCVVETMGKTSNDVLRLIAAKIGRTAGSELEMRSRDRGGPA